MKLQQKSMKDSISRRPFNVKHSRRETQLSFEETEQAPSLQGYETSVSLPATDSPNMIQGDNEQQWWFASGAFAVIG